MIERFVVVGLSHRTAPVEVRERLARPPAEGGPSLAAVLGLPGVSEALLLSTCNRVEVHASTDDPRPVADLLGGHEARVAAALYVRSGEEAVRHVFRVAASLDSMIVGEAQVAGQVRGAYEAASAAGACGPLLHALLPAALGCAGRVRAETGLGEGAVSIPSAAVELAEKIFGDLAGRTVFVLGAGEMAELVLRAVVQAGARVGLVVSRGRERAAALAAEAGGEAAAFPELAARLPEAEIVIASSAAPHAVVRPADVLPGLAARGGRPLFFVDIAVPRDVDRAVHDLPDVYVYDIDDLQAVVAANVREREAEIGAAEAIAAVEVGRFLTWAAARKAVPAIKALRAKDEAIRAEEVRRALTRLPDLGPAEREAFERLSRSIVQKILHEPTVTVKEEEKGMGIPEKIAALRKLFALE